MEWQYWLQDRVSERGELKRVDRSTSDGTLSRESPTFRPRVSSKFRPRQFPDRGGGLWRNGGDGVGAAAM